MRFIATRACGLLAAGLLAACSPAGETSNSGASVEPSKGATAAAGTVSGAVADPGYAGSYAEAWGPALGSQLPELAQLDAKGQQRTLADLTGENGLLLLFSRSADW